MDIKKWNELPGSTAVQGWPYTNLHDLNLDWIINTTKEFAAEISRFEDNVASEVAGFEERVTVKIGDFEGTIQEYTDKIDVALATVDEKITYIDNFFSSLDVQQEIDNKLDSMSADGSLAALLKPFADAWLAQDAPGVISAWLAAHITEPEGVVIDSSLSVSGAAADALAAGQKIRALDRYALRQVVGTYTDGNSQGTIYADMDTLPPSSIIFYASANPLHAPYYPFSGYVTTINVNGNSGSNHEFTVQYAVNIGTAYYQKMYYRIKYASWSAWLSMSEYAGSGMHQGLKNFTVLGDSITVGLSYPTAAAGITVKSWAKILADRCGTSCDIFAAGGLTTQDMSVSEWFQIAKSNIHANQFAIIALGINDVSSNVPLSTFQENYRQLISGMLEHHKFVFCCTIPKGFQDPAAAKSYNQSIRQIAKEYANAFVLEVTLYNEQVNAIAHLGHMSSVGYGALAEIISKCMDGCMSIENYFKQGRLDM